MNNNQSIENLINEHQVKQVVNYICENGGSVNSAIDFLGLSVSPRLVNDYAEKNGIDLKSFRFVGKRYGNWIITNQPPKDAGLNDFIVRATCMLCGSSREVHLSNLRSGKSKSCKPCGLKRKKSFNVVSLSSGKIFRSIRDFVHSENPSFSYQKVRSILIREGTIKTETDEYMLLQV